MKKYCDWWLLPLLACLLTGCGDDDYHYPSVKLEFLTAFSGADGYLQSVVTDEGETLPVVEDKTKTNIEANASVRVISNYASEVTADGTAGAVLYALSGVLSVVPQTAFCQFQAVVFRVGRRHTLQILLVFTQNEVCFVYGSVCNSQ